eukprot:3630820-Rhodomonas_salina.1
MNHQGGMVNSLGSGRALLSRPTNLPGMGFNAVNVCNEVDRITSATASAAPGKSPRSPRVPTMDAKTAQSSSAEDDWMELHMLRMVAERSWVGATVCERHLLLNPAVAREVYCSHLQAFKSDPVAPRESEAVTTPEDKACKPR